MGELECAARGRREKGSRLFMDEPTLSTISEVAHRVIDSGNMLARIGFLRVKAGSHRVRCRVVGKGVERISKKGVKIGHFGKEDGSTLGRTGRKRFGR